MATNEEFKWAGSSEPVSVAANKVADLATFGVVGYALCKTQVVEERH